MSASATHLGRWLAASVRHKLLAMALLPLALVLPLLVLALLLWSNAAYDRLLITKVRSDLAVARGYFTQVLGEVGAGVDSIAASHALQQAQARWQNHETLALRSLLARQRERLRFDFVNLYTPDGTLLATDRDGTNGEEPHKTADRSLPPRDDWGERATLHDAPAGDGPATAQAQLALMDGALLQRLAPHLAPRLAIALIETRGASPTQRSVEDRALVMLATRPVFGPSGEVVALLRGGLLLNQNLALIDHINRIVYPDGALPFDSQGTATLFMDDVRITTNVRLFQNQRAIGTRVTQIVRDAVMGRGVTWLDSAFVVNDWYVSAYEPLVDAHGQRVGMLYVGFLERPFRMVKYTMLAVMVGIFLAVMALSVVVSLRWARSIFRPVEQMNQTMHRVESGDTAARVGPVAAQDEIGQLANHLDALLDVIARNTQALQRWGEELDAKVAERTRELQQAQRQLVKSEKLAAIGQLTASIAHEINNPIAVMQGNLDVMRESLGPQTCAAVAPELRLLDQQIERMRLIVTQLLQYARPTEFAGYVEALSPPALVRDCLVLVAHLLAHTGIAVHHDDQTCVRVSINRQELQQVLINLMVNAIQAMPRGGTLWLRTRDWPGADDTPQGAVIEVEDSGPGLSDAALAHLFQPFQTTKHDGNGLGLWISQSLVERYGGRIEAQNSPTPPHGARVRVWLLCEAVAPVESSASTQDGQLTRQ